MELKKMFDDRRVKIIQMYNDPIIKPMVDRIIEDICVGGGGNYDDVYNYILFGKNIINPCRPYMCGEDVEDIRGMLDTSIRSYNSMVLCEEDTFPEDKVYFLRKIQQNLKWDISDERDKVSYSRFIGRCIDNLKHIED